MAGLSGNQLSAYIVRKTGEFTNVLIVTAILYIVALLISLFVVKKVKDEL